MRTDTRQNSAEEARLADDSRHRGTELLAQLRRRNDAARRLPPLPHSGRRDPLTPRERADCWERP